jgi:predicted transcriptional regulator
MEQVKEREHVTEVKRRILEARKLRGITSKQVFVKHSLEFFATVHRQLGGEAALAYLTVIGTHHVASERERKEGLIVRTSFQKATGLPARQFRRGLTSLAKAGYIATNTAPGRKPRVQLTAKGRKGLAYSETEHRAR